MNDNPEQQMNDRQRLSFIKAFQDLLDERIEPESEEISNIKLGCEVLKFEIRNILERIKALDILDDDFSIINFCEHEVDLPLRRYVELRKKPWLQGKLTIALMGHLKTGKTSAMNSFFGEDFPVSSEEATALATFLYDGENPKQTALLVDKEGGVQEINSEQLKLFSLENSFNFPFARMFSHIAKKSKHPALVDKTFIDTPGFLSSNSEHAATAYKVLDYCDVIFWFIDVRKSVSVSEVSFIKHQIRDKPLYVIFSFTDARGTTKEGIKAAQDVIKQALSDIDIKGYLQFGKKESTQEAFRKEFGKTIDSLCNYYQPKNPIFQIIQLLSVLQDKIVLAQKSFTEQHNKNKKELDELANNISGAARSVQSALSSAGNRFSSMMNTLDNKCSNTYACLGGTYSTLRSNVDQLASSLQTIVNAWDNVDYNVIVQFGTLSANISKIEDIISRLDSINSDINAILNKFKS